MITRIRNSWAMMKRSLAVPLTHPKLLLFPCVITLLTGIIGLFFLAPALLFAGTLFDSAAWHAMSKGTPQAPSYDVLTPWGWGYVAAVYMVSMVAATFFNVAFFHEIMAALNNDSVSITRGLRFACSRIKSILAWSLFAGLVGLLIKLLEDRLGWVSRWILRWVGIAWSVASIFVIPVMIREPDQTRPLDFLKKSALTLRKTWGEGLVGYLGLNLINAGILMVSLAFLAAAGLFSYAIGTWWVLGIAAVLWLLAMIALSYVVAVATKTFQCALYIYASEGVVPAPYTRDMLDAAWKVKV